MLSGLLVVGGFVAGAIILARLVTTFGRNELLTAHNDLAGFIFAVVGVVYAVVLGFVAVGVWERFVAAEESTYREAGALMSLYRDAGQFAAGQSLRRDLRSYVQDTVRLDWPAMTSGRESDATEATGERVALDVERIEPATDAQRDIHASMLSDIDEALGDRELRLGEDASGLNGIMWVVVFAGALTTIGFSLLFGFKSPVMQSLMVGALALVIGLVVYMTMSLDYPFRGAIRVGPEAFERAAAAFAQIDALDAK